MGGHWCSWGYTPSAGGRVKGWAATACRFRRHSWGFQERKIPLSFASEPAGQGPGREKPMTLQGLGYAGFGSDALDDWRQFGTGLIGLQAVERGNSLLAFRMDDRKQRI